MEEGGQRQTEKEEEVITEKRVIIVRDSGVERKGYMHFFEPID